MAVTERRVLAWVRRDTARAAFALAGVVGLMSAGRAFAASGTWSGAAGDGLWTTSGNWDNVPGVNDGSFVSTDIATFNNLAGTTAIITVDNNRNIAGLTFDTEFVDAYTFQGPDLHLTAGGTTQMTTDVANGQTVNNVLAIEGASYEFRNNSANAFIAFTFGGNVSTNVASGPAALTLTGTNPGGLIFGSIVVGNAFNGVIDKGTASSLDLNITGSAWILANANTYGGTTTVDGVSSYVVVDNANALSTGALVLKNGGHLQSYSAPFTLANELKLTAGEGVIDGSLGITINGDTTFAAGTTLRNNLTTGQPLTLGNVFLSDSLLTPRSVTVSGSGATIINGALADAPVGIGGTVNLTKGGTGSLTINSSNAGYTGALTISAGAVVLGSDAAIGVNTITLAGGTLQGTGTGMRTVANNILLTANSIVSGAQNITLTGSITNSGGNRTLGAQSLTNTVTFAGPIYLSETSGTGRTLTIDGGSISSVQPYVVSGVISNYSGAGGAAGSLSKAGWGNLILSANNTYTGTTSVTFDTLTIGNGGSTGSVAGPISIVSGAHLRFNRSGAYTITNAITGAGDVGTSGPAGSTYTTTNAYTYTGGFVLGNGNTFILATDSTPTSGTVTSGPFGTGAFSLATTPGGNTTGQVLEGSGSNHTVANSISLANNLTVDGGFNVTLSGPIAMSGSRTLTGNVKVLTLGTAGGTLTLSGASAVHTFDSASASTITILSNINGANQQIAKTGAGLLNFNGTSNYTGATAVNQGGLVFVTTASLPTLAPAGSVTVGSSANLFGAVGYSGNASGIVDPTFVARLNAASTGSFAILTADASRTLDFTAAPLSSVPNMGIGALGIATYSGTLTPAAGGYRFGGGRGTLNVTSLLGDSGGPRNATIIGGAAITLSAVNTYTGNTNVAAAGVLTIPTAASLASPTINVTSGGTLNANGALATTATVNANGTVNFGGNATSVTTTRQLAALNIGTGAVTKLTAAAFPFTPTILNPATLTFADSTATLNLTNNELITQGTLTDIVSKITSNQIFTTSTGGALGSLDLNNGTIEVRFTLLGDTNLDGKVDVTDLGNMATNYGTGTGATWVQGDTNYSGGVDVTDLGNLASNYGSQLASGPSTDGELMLATAQATAATSAAVPEPASVGLVLLAGFTSLNRRRRRAL